VSAVALAGIVVAISFFIGLLVGTIAVMALPAVRESFRRQLPADGDGQRKPSPDGDGDHDGDRSHWPGETGYTNGQPG
jgi:hypothetical protein